VKTPTVLLILEESEDLEIYGSFLRHSGYETLMCSSLSEGINSLETESVSLVIVSQGTRAFEGRQVLERSLQLHPKVPVLVVARVLDIHCYIEAMDLGAIDYLERPDPQDLVWVVDTQMLRGAIA
jgi:DNA-binding NtrC family response regulator